MPWPCQAESTANQWGQTTSELKHDMTFVDSFPRSQRCTFTCIENWFRRFPPMSSLQVDDGANEQPALFLLISSQS